MRAANLALRFLLELAALGILAYWGATSAGPAWQRAALAIAAPTAVAVLWGTLIAPRAPVRVPEGGKAVLALSVFALAAVALASRGLRVLAVTLAVIALLNAVLLRVQRR